MLQVGRGHCGGQEVWRSDWSPDEDDCQEDVEVVAVVVAGGPLRRQQGVLHTPAPREVVPP